MDISKYIVSAIGLVLLASAALAQTPGGEQGGGWRGPTGFDPNWMFDGWDRNRDGIVTRDEITDRRSLERFDDYLRRAGATDGKLNRETFLKVFQQRMEERMRPGGGDPRDSFRNLDRNNDGKLDREEIQQTRRLRFEVDRWDGNRDGSIDQAEFQAYMNALNPPSAPPSAPPAASVSPPSTAAPPAGNPAPPPATEPALPVMHRAGNLPAGIPGWFKDLDGNNDGQVAMYEWKDRPLDEYLAIDRNNDGFITIAEALRHASPKRR